MSNSGERGGMIGDRRIKNSIFRPARVGGTSSSAGGRSISLKTVRWTGRAMTKGLTWQGEARGRSRNDSNNRAVRQNRTDVFDNPTSHANTASSLSFSLSRWWSRASRESEISKKFRSILFFARGERGWLFDVIWHGLIGNGNARSIILRGNWPISRDRVIHPVNLLQVGKWSGLCLVRLGRM